MVVYLDWTDKSKIAAFREGLKESIRDLLITVRPKPIQFDEFVKICIEIDNAVHANELDKRQVKPGNTPKNTNNSAPRQTSFAQPRPQPPMSESSSLPMGEPMQIDATKTKCGPLMQAEREQRHAKGLCMYYGGQHKIADCPNMSEAAKKCFADKQKAFPQAGKA